MVKHIVLVLILATLVGVPQASAQTDQRCFAETNQCMSGRIREFWEQNGGLPVFGYPIGPQGAQSIEGVTVQAQNFERNRLELHPENARPYDVLLGRLGADRLTQLGKDWHSYPQGGQQDGCRFFPETNQSVCGTILRTWRASGLEIDGRAGKTESENLALFGLPLSPLITETQADGVERQIQWFERARFEIHPENQPPYDVLLGLLGNELRDNGGAAPAPQPQPQPPAPPAGQTLTGSGAKVENISVGTNSTVTLSHDGSSNFSIWAYADGGRRQLLVNEIGGYHGVRWLGPGSYMLEITADGNWSIAIAPIGQANDAVNNLGGTGDYVSGYFPNPGRPTAYHFSHNGSSNFAVWLVCANGRDLGVNEIGPVDSDTVVEARGTPCFWDVTADGGWSITKK